MAKKFYDTCALLELQGEAFKEFFYVSDVTLRELENIKTSAKKDEETKWRSRCVMRLLTENEDKYEVILFNERWFFSLDEFNDQFIDDLGKHHSNGILSLDIPDDQIISCAIASRVMKKEDIVFVTKDLSCRAKARAVSLKVELPIEKTDNYTGYTEVFWGESDMANFYQDIQAYQDRVKINEYFIINDRNGRFIDSYVRMPEGLVKVNYIECKTSVFGNLKTKDVYQTVALESMTRNPITMVSGPAGSGKSWLAMNALFRCLEKGEIEKIIVFCNTVATRGAAKLGLKRIRLK